MTVHKKHANAHILVMSRDETDIRMNLRGAAALDVAKCVGDDVDLFVQSCVNRIVEAGDACKNDFRSQIPDRMKGVSESCHPRISTPGNLLLICGRRFRWVALVEQKCLACINPEMLQKALENLPETLEGIHADVLRQMPKEYQEVARLAFIWLSYSRRPLTLQEMACAVRISYPHKVFEIYTSSLVSLRRKEDHSLNSANEESDIDLGDIDQFDHFSVKEHLTSEESLASSDASYFYATPRKSHLTIAEISVSHLIQTNKIDLGTEKEIKASPAKDYHVEVWSHGEDPLLYYSALGLTTFGGQVPMISENQSRSHRDRKLNQRYFSQT